MVSASRLFRMATIQSARPMATTIKVLVCLSNLEWVHHTRIQLQQCLPSQDLGCLHSHNLVEWVLLSLEWVLLNQEWVLLSLVWDHCSQEWVLLSRLGDHLPQEWVLL